MMRARIETAGWSERPVAMRLPFQFGSTEVRETAEAHCELRCVIDGRDVIGQSAQLMVPRWFDKRAGLSNSETIDELRATVTAACEPAIGMEGPAVAITRELRSEAARKLPPETPALAAGFGPALVEMALIDAICRAAGLAFWQAAREDVFGLVPNCPEDLGPDALRASLSRITPPETIALRHTIGFDAPLLRSEVGADAPRDGLPVSVEEVIVATGISAFKIKLKGAPEADLARLRAIASVIDRLPSHSVTLDANEQYAVAPFCEFLDGLVNDAALARLRAGLRFVEQPFARETALEEPVEAALPLVIDESDDAEDSFARALKLGWAGTSIKSCKGVLRALINRARADAAGAILSGEDLTCQPGLCWQQDTAMAAACGVQDVERNGHHFAGGMQGASAEEIEARLAAHADIYTRSGSAPALKLEHGEVAIASLGKPGFGNIIKETN
ncbi:mandelate racemase [Amaricoccus macauensis]|uniref:mandelate racemase n=1 Tax=Amaricoccus macauensis TaxID=57001 RepID=UPI003C7B3EDD